MKLVFNLAFILSLTLLVGCTAEDNENITPLASSNPKVIKGVMVFDTELQLHTFLEKLDKEMSLLSSTEKEDYLLNLEREIGHQSLLFTQQDITFRSGEEAFTVEEIMAMGDEDYIYDELEKFILNNFYEVVVDDTLYVQQAKNIEIKAPFENTEARLVAQQLPKGNPSIPAELFRSGGTLVKNPGVKYDHFFRPPSNPPNPPNPPSSVCDFIGYEFIPLVSTVSPCSNTSSINASLTRVCADGADSEGQNGFWTVDFGDGTSETFDFVDEINYLKNYDDDNNYTITITVDFIDRDGEGASFSQTFDVGLAPAGSCTMASEERAVFVEHPTADLALRAMIWRRQSILGTNVGGFSQAWRLAEDAKWVKDGVSDLEVGVDIIWRWKPSRSNGCEIESRGVDFDSCTNCKKTTVREWSIARRGAYVGREAQTSHRMTRFGLNEITVDLNLDMTCN